MCCFWGFFHIEVVPLLFRFNAPVTVSRTLCVCVRVLGGGGVGTPFIFKSRVHCGVHSIRCVWCLPAPLCVSVCRLCPGSDVRRSARRLTYFYNLSFLKTRHVQKKSTIFKRHYQLFFIFNIAGVKNFSLHFNSNRFSFEEITHTFSVRKQIVRSFLKLI